MSDLQDFTQKNRRHTGTTGILVSDTGSGPGDRVNEKGRLRFNDTTDLLNTIMVMTGNQLTLLQVLQV